MLRAAVGLQSGAVRLSCASSSPELQALSARLDLDRLTATTYDFDTVFETEWTLRHALRVARTVCIACSRTGGAVDFFAHCADQLQQIELELAREDADVDCTLLVNDCAIATLSSTSSTLSSTKRTLQLALFPIMIDRARIALQFSRQLQRDATVRVTGVWLHTSERDRLTIDLQERLILQTAGDVRFLMFRGFALDP